MLIKIFRQQYLLSAATAVALFYSALGNAMDKFEWCPSVIDTAQTVRDIPKEYVALMDALGPSRLTYVVILEGMPNKLAELIPDQNTTDNFEWNFSNMNRQGDVRIRCHYSRTNIVLDRKLPTSIHHCSVIFWGRDHGLLEGARQIKSISCN